MRVLLIGKGGQVGSALEQTLKAIGQLTAFGRAEMDLLQPNSTGEKIQQTKPDVIVNAVAYTAVDRAESERDAAFAVNCHAVAALAREAKRLDALLVHFSTDYVFDGEKATPYTEEDAARPLNVYGESKLAGERAIAAAGCRHLIFRTSWVYAPRGRNFVLAILAAAKDKGELRVVDDQRGAPTPAHFIADAVARVIASPGEESDGIYHLTAGGEATWCEFAKEILAARKIAVPVVPIPSSEYQTAAPRPKNSLLDNTKLRRVFGFSLPDWREGLREVSSRIAAVRGSDEA